MIEEDGSDLQKRSFNLNRERDYLFLKPKERRLMLNILMLPMIKQQVAVKNLNKY